MTTALLAAAALTAGGAATAVPARADVGVGDVAGYAKTAYGIYQSLFENQLTLEQATSQILDAVTAAKTQIVDEIDAMAAGDVKSCAQSAVIDFSDIATMTVDKLQQFATDATMCVTTAWSQIPQASDPGAVDVMGFALNIVGPIALAARSMAYGSTDPGTLQLRDTVIQANQSNLVRLLPVCGGVPGEVVNGEEEVDLLCTAYNGDQGDAGVIFIGAGAPIPTGLDYSAGITQAAARTSYPVSVAALDGLLPDPVVAAPGDQIGYFNHTAQLQLAASGAAAPYSWKVTGLPPGLSATSSGLITGTFSQTGSWTMFATATDTQAQFATVSFTWTVRGIPMILAGTVGNRTVTIGTAVTAAPGVSGGTAPYTWTVTGLPAGLSADSSGRVSGTVAANATNSTVTFTVADANGQSDSRTAVWSVSLPSVSVPNLLGMDQASAISWITSLGLSVGSVSHSADCNSPGDVENQNPSAGVVVTEGATVNITVSTCPSGGGGGSGGSGGTGGGGGNGGGGILPK